MTTNQQVRNADFCGKVPLHQTNLVQPHGILLIVSKEDLNILQVSENCMDLMGKPASEIASTRLSHYITAQEATLLKERFSSPVDGKEPLLFTLEHHGVLKKFLALVQAEPDYYIIEVEKEPVGQDSSFITVYQELKFAITAIESATTIEAASTTVVQELKRISKFDKVMVYRFDEDWNGTVTAEAMEPGMESYFGLKFPASDIPKQARDMYQKNAYRFIPDVGYTPVRLYPVLNPITGGFTNLTDSNLRSVAGVHLEYLRNMGVVASMSTRIVKDGRLWGLISCHHRTPKNLSYQECSLFEFLSTIISAKISALGQRQADAFHSGMQGRYAALVEALYGSTSLLEGLHEEQHEVLKLLQADGVSIMLDNRLQSFGKTPAKSEVEDLLFWIQSNDVQETVQESNLSNAYEGAAKYADDVSGLLTLPLQAQKGNYMLAFRQAEVHQVAWGGNPADALTFEPDGKRYHPRQSFATWQETVRQQAVPWKKEELEIAEQFRNFLSNFANRKM